MRSNMLIDQSGRVWSMRPDEAMIAEASRLRQQVLGADAATYPEGALVSLGLSGGEPLDGSDFARVIDGTAIVPVRGMLMRSYSWFFWSYEEICRDIQLAQDSRAVERIVLDIDSPGGLVSGLADAFEVIRDCDKPVEAFAGGMCASAAYHLASGCDRITAGSGTIIGSVGSVIEYVDFEPMFEAMGAKIVRIVAKDSPNKRLDPHSEEGRAEMQALVDAACDRMITDIAQGRGISEAEVLSGFGQGTVFEEGEALRRGMIDGRGTLKAMIAGLAARDDETAAPAPAEQETTMDWTSLTVAQLREHRADLVTEIEAAVPTGADEDAVTARVDEAVTVERTRMAEIDEVAVEGHQALTEQAKSEGWSVEKYALEVVKADKASGAGHLKQLASEDAAANVTPLRPAETRQTISGGDDDAADEGALKAAWDKDADLRREFGGNFDAYKAYAKADAQGRVKVLKRTS